MDQKALKDLLNLLFSVIKVLAAGRPMVLLAVSVLEKFLEPRLSAVAASMDSEPE